MCYSPSFANGSIGMRWLCCKWDLCVFFSSFFSYWNHCCHLNAKHHVILMYHAINYKYYSHFDICNITIYWATLYIRHSVLFVEITFPLILSIYRYFALFPSLTLWRVQYFQPFSLYCRNIGKCLTSDEIHKAYKWRKSTELYFLSKFL